VVVHQKEDLLVIVLMQLIVIILAARVAGSAAIALRQPRAVGEILAGLALGPSLLGAVAPDVSAWLFTPQATPPVQILSQIGLLLLLFQIGSEFEFSHLSKGRNSRATIVIACVSVAAPLAAGFGIGQISAPYLAGSIDPLVYSLFTAVAMAITALPILGRILREYQLEREPVGVIAISAAALNDVAGWVLLAAVVAVATATFSLQAAALQVGGIVLFGLGVLVLGRPITDLMMKTWPTQGGSVPTPLMAVMLALIFAAGIATEALGIFTIFGGFLLGILVHRYPAFVAAWRSQMSAFVLVFFLPIFFTYTGLRTNVLGLDSWADWGWCACLFSIAVMCKIAPVYLAARAMGMSGHEAGMLGVLMNTRALMELIVLNIGFSLGFIPQDVFTMLVIMAVGTTIMTGPLLRWLLRKAGRPFEQAIEA
jgi:Kef-type K+ transport system membrane component KefB